jgi:hypothetical protein
MSVLITMEVGPVDWSKFKSAVDWMNAIPEPAAKSLKVYRRQDNPAMLLVTQEWDSHDAFHASTEKYGDEFNRRAGTEGLDWRTGVWSM